MPIPPKQSYSRLTVRLPVDLLAQVEAEAIKNGRSANAEITARLIEAYASPTLADLDRRHLETQQMIRQAISELDTLVSRK